MSKLILPALCLVFLGLWDSGVAPLYAQSPIPESGTQSAVGDKKADRKELLDYSYKILLDSYNKYLDNVFKTIGFLLLTIGWLITSDKSRMFFQEDRRARIIFLVGIVLMWLVNAASLFDNYFEGTRIIESIEKIDYMDPVLFDRYKPKLYKTIGSLVLVSCLFALLFLIIYRLKPNVEKPVTTK
ncbi:MAG TPA: hypothetical protein VGW36_01315 [Pyrinomonadaceae bacterium]|nr:hypothetical protein [Pyrinomonadaceae bacterium]